MSLDKSLNDMALDLGCDFFGVADLTSVHQFVRDQGGEGVGSYPRAVVVGIRLQNAIVDQLPQRANFAVAVNYRHHGYAVINLRLDLAVSRLASLLQQQGYRTLPIPASERYDNDRICSVFSHKLAAHLAGLGWIGKSCLLVTPEAGPRVRWGSILTNAPLEPTGTPMDGNCGSCRECVDICPAGAFTGVPFREDEPRSVRYDARKCEEYHNSAANEIGLKVCGMCLYICPFGRTA